MSLVIYLQYKGEKDPARRAEKVLSMGALAILLLTLFLPAGLLMSPLRSMLIRRVKGMRSTCPTVPYTECGIPN